MRAGVSGMSGGLLQCSMNKAPTARSRRSPNRPVICRSGVEQILEDVIRDLVTANAHAVEFRIAFCFERLDLVTPGLHPCLRVDATLEPSDEACPEAALRCCGDVGGDIRHLETSQSK